MLFSRITVPAEQQLRILLRGDMMGFVLSLLVLFVGFAALAIHLLRLKSKDWTLLWFGLFVLLYGLRSLSRHMIARALFDAPTGFWRYFDSIISDVIVTPALLFFEGIYGRGWRSSLRWLLLAQGAWGVAAIAMSIIRHNPGGTPDPSNFLLVMLPVLLIAGHMRGYRPPRSSWAAIMFAGFSIFLLSVIVDHLRDAGLTPWQFRTEPFGFVTNLACLGYVAVKQFVSNEQHLIALDEEMKSAARIQASILPGSVPRVAGLRIAVRYKPMTAVAGDFYDFLATPDGIGILVADVTGHGVPAALVASMVKVAVAAQAEHAHDPARVISALNLMMCRQVQGQLTTAGYVFLERVRGTARYAAAGHPPLVMWRKSSNTLRQFRENGLLMGLLGTEQYVNTPIELQLGDRLLLYTDGVLEASNSSQEFFGEERLAGFITAEADLPADAFADALLSKLAAWSGSAPSSQQTDDITLVVVDIC
jgi:sigma-B regulation protein RsbU (phosphoserine phosphatase)